MTKYRRRAITDRVREHLRATCADVCAKMGANLREFDGEEDHVHLLVSYPPKLAISRLVNSLKLVSARLLRKRNLPEVRHKLWGPHFWNAQLPRIISATDPDFGWAAATAVGRWQYTSPARNGRAVDVRVRVPLVFTPMIPPAKGA